MRHLLPIVALLGCATLFGAQPDYTTVIFTFSGTLGPIVNSGSDCLGLNGQSVNVTAMLETGQGPFRSTMNTVTYRTNLISGSVGPLSLSGTWSVIYTISSKANAITLMGPGAMGSTIKLTGLIPPGTISLQVFQHPRPLAPKYSPEPLSYPGSSLSYTATGCSTTQLALTGQLAGSTQ
jgi:hypothetical protein